VALKKYNCFTCKNHPIKKEDNYVSVDMDQIGVKIQNIKNIVDCHNVKFINGKVICRTCEDLIYKEAQ
jgi:hypothetical protein